MCQLYFIIYFYLSQNLLFAVVLSLITMHEVLSTDPLLRAYFTMFLAISFVVLSSVQCATACLSESVSQTPSLAMIKYLSNGLKTYLTT